MERLKKILTKHPRISLDTCIWIYHFEQHRRFAKAAGEVLNFIAKGRCEAIISELVLMELVTGPLSIDRQDVADEYELILSHYPHLTLTPITRDILLLAANIRAVYGFKSPDAIILATAQSAGASLVVTNDRRWERFQELDILSIDDL